MRGKLHLLLESNSPYTGGNKRENEAFFYHLHGVSDEDVPVVPAGAIVLKYSITSLLF